MGLHSVMLSVVASLVGISFAGAQQSVPGEYIVKLKSMASPAGVLNKMQGKIALKGSFARMNIYHVALKPGADQGASFEELASDPDVEYVEPNYIFNKADISDRAGLGAPDKVYEAGEMGSLEQYSTLSGT
ncbi:MAG: hypothetical protein EOP06_13725, partial [Proteobacteria bacterium]